MDAEKKQPERNRIDRFRFYLYPVVIFFLDPHLSFDLFQHVGVRLRRFEVLARRCFNHPRVFAGHPLIAHQSEVISVLHVAHKRPPFFPFFALFLRALPPVFFALTAALGQKFFQLLVFLLLFLLAQRLVILLHQARVKFAEIKIDVECFDLSGFYVPVLVQVLDDFTLGAGIFLRPLKVVMVNLGSPAHNLFGIVRGWKAGSMVFTLRFLRWPRPWLRRRSGRSLRRRGLLRCAQRSPQYRNQKQTAELEWSFRHETCNVQFRRSLLPPTRPKPAKNGHNSCYTWVQSPRKTAPQAQGTKCQHSASVSSLLMTNLLSE